MERPHTTIATFLGVTCVKTMVTLEETLQLTHDWAVDRIHTLCDREDQDLLLNIEDAHAIQSEFSEWLDPNIDDHDIYSLEYLGEEDD